MAYYTDAPASRRGFSPLAILGGLVRKVAVWSDVSRGRRALREMGWSRLEDLGLSEDAAKREARKPFWLTRRGF